MAMTKAKWISSVLGAISIWIWLYFSCSSNHRQPVHEAEANFAMHKSGDPKLQQAKEEAIREFPRFKEAFELKKGDHFVVKTAFTEGDKVEHMWVDVNKIKEDSIDGTLDSEPLVVNNIKEDTEVTVRISDISDWMIVRGDKYFGMFSLRAFPDQSREMKIEPLSEL